MRAAIAFLALLAAACGAPAGNTETARSAAPEAACQAAAESAWRVGETAYAVAASAAGADCPSAIARIEIKTPDGAVLFVEPYPVSEVPLAFSRAEDQARLQNELEAWTQNVAQGPDASILPPWAEGAAKPPYFQPSVNREDYEAARAAKRPIFCYPDGGESNACVALDAAAPSAALLGSWTPERP